MSNKKITVLHFLCGLKSGGVEQMLINYYSNMNREQCQFDICYQHEPIKLCIDGFKKLGCRTYRVPSKAVHPIQNAIETYRLIKKNHYDVVHAHMDLNNFIPLFCAKMAGVRVRISHSHISKKGTSKLFYIYAAICKFLIKLSATEFFACGKDAGLYLYGEKIAQSDKMVVIHNAINISEFLFDPTKREIERAKLHIKDELVIGHIGRFAEQKNHLFLVDLFSNIHKKRPDAILLLVGTGELEDNVHNKVKMLKLEDSVIFYGVSGHISDLYQAMDVFVLPSLYEGFPVAGIEAQVSGLPTFFSDSITRDVEISEHAHFLMLNDKLDNWANSILLYSSTRKLTVQTLAMMENKGFDILKEAVKLQILYRNLVLYKKENINE